MNALDNGVAAVLFEAQLLCQGDTFASLPTFDALASHFTEISWGTTVVICGRLGAALTTIYE